MSEQANKTDTQTEQSRRGFLTRIWVGLGGLALLEFIAVGVAYLRPRGDTGKPGEFGTVLTAGPVDSFEPGTVTAFPRGHFYLARLKDGGFLALSRKCTHLGCTVPWHAEEKRFACPCHGSAFDIRGDVISPPAPRALDLYRVIMENKTVKVDTGRPIRRSGFRADQITYPDAGT